MTHGDLSSEVITPVSCVQQADMGVRRRQNNHGDKLTSLPAGAPDAEGRGRSGDHRTPEAGTPAALWPSHLTTTIGRCATGRDADGLPVLDPAHRGTVQLVCRVTCDSLRVFDVSYSLARPESYGGVVYTYMCFKVRPVG
jgi:hypothetical protein